MLTRLLPEQVAKFWDVIKYAVEESLPPLVGGHPDRMNRILTSLLSGGLTCWASYRKCENGNIFEGICITKLIYDEASHTRNLLLYTVYGYNKIVEDSWANAFISIAKYAKKHKCNEIIAYTDVPYLVKKAKEFGADTSFTFVSFNIKKTVKFLNGLEE